MVSQFALAPARAILRTLALNSMKRCRGVSLRLVQRDWNEKEIGMSSAQRKIVCNIRLQQTLGAVIVAGQRIGLADVGNLELQMGKKGKRKGKNRT